MTNKIKIVLVVVSLLSGAVVAWTSAEEVPKLTEVQSLQLTLAIKEAENAQLRLEKALRERDDAIKEAQDFVRSLQKPGFTLDVQKREYMPAPKPSGTVSGTPE